VAENRVVIGRLDHQSPKALKSGFSSEIVGMVLKIALEVFMDIFPHVFDIGSDVVHVFLD
jgi:hypothetical protein